MTQYMLKTHTLNIAENTERKHSIGKHKAAYDQYIQSYRSEITEEQTSRKAALHKKQYIHTTTSQKNWKVFKDTSNLHSI